MLPSGQLGRSHGVGAHPLLLWHQPSLVLASDSIGVGAWPPWRWHPPQVASRLERRHWRQPPGRVDFCAQQHRPWRQAASLAPGRFGVGGDLVCVGARLCRRWLFCCIVCCLGSVSAAAAGDPVVEAAEPSAEAMAHRLAWTWWSLRRTAGVQVRTGAQHGIQ